MDAALLGRFPGQEQDLLLNVRGQIQQIHNLG